MKILRLLSLSLLITLSLATTLKAQIEPIDEDGLAIGGYDVVAYFSGEATLGNKDIRTTYNKATYRFATGKNLKAFKANPEKYLPQFNGHCAWAIGEKGKKFSINPETFDIIDGKLYLFYSHEKTNTMLLWNAETTRLKAQAEKNWNSIENK